MADRVWQRPPEAILRVLGEEGYRWLLQLERHIYGDTGSLDGTLDARNIRPIETLKTEETDTYKALKPDGGAGLSFMPVPDGEAQFIMGAADASIPNGLVLTEGTNIGITLDSTALTATFAVDPQGAGSGLDADKLDAREASQFVWSLGKTGDPIAGDILLAEGSNVTITRSGQTFTFATSGAGGTGDEVLGWFLGA